MAGMARQLAGANAETLGQAVPALESAWFSDPEPAGPLDLAGEYGP